MTVTATDGTATDSQYFVWNVSSPISLTDPATQSSTEGGTASLSISRQLRRAAPRPTSRRRPAGRPEDQPVHWRHESGTVAATGDAADGPYEV